MLFAEGFSPLLGSEGYQGLQAAVINAHPDPLARHALDGEVFAGTVLQVATFVVIGLPGRNQMAGVKIGGQLFAGFAGVVNHMAHRAAGAAGPESSVGRTGVAILCSSP